MSFSQYSRQPAPFATRPTPGSPFTRSEPVYDHHNPRVFPSSSGHPEISAQAQALSGRLDRTAYYDYPATSRDSRGEHWNRTDSWYNAPRRSSPPLHPPPTLPPPPLQHYPPSYYGYSPPPPPPPPPPSTAYDNAPSQVQYREDGHAWDSPPADRSFEPSSVWRHSREPSNSRISNLLNPAPPSPANDDRRWRDNTESALIRDYGRQYSQNYPPYEQAPTYYDSRPSYTSAVDNFGQQYYDERLPQSRPVPNYRAHPSRPVKKQTAMGDYKRQRQPSQGQYRQSDNVFFGPLNVSSPSTYISNHSRNDSSYSQPYQRLNSAADTLQVKPIYGPEVDMESSGEESEGKSYRTDSPTQSPRKSRQSEGDPQHPRLPSTRRFSPVRNDFSAQQAVARNTRDLSTPSTLPIGSPRALSDATAGRQSVMSVHNLIAPTIATLPTPLSMVQKGLTTLPTEDVRIGVPGPSTQNDSPEPATVPFTLANAQEVLEIDKTAEKIAQVTEPKEVVAPVPIPASVSVSQSLDDAISEDISVLNIQSSRQSPKPDTDKTLADADEPPASVPEAHVNVTDSQIAQENVTPVVRPPSWLDRPKPDEKMISDTLRKAIIARRNYSIQTREQRVNPILMANRAIADPPPDEPHTTPDALVREVSSTLFSLGGEEQQANIRAALASNFAVQKELLAEKTQKLRDEYLVLHKRWLKHCAKLDVMFKANDMHEVASVSSRTTRRSAATLGDAVRSDLEMEQIIATLGNEDLTDPNHLAVRNVATIPDMISVERGRLEYLFDDTNGFVDNPASFYDPRSGFHDWTPEEEQIFYDKYAEHPKQFGIIASHLPNKTAAQCVLYYYIHKKKLIDFRQAANSGASKRKGTRKGRKRKGNALLADIEQTDSQRPAGRGRRRGGGRGRGSGIQPAEESDRPKRRRAAAAAAGPKIVMAKEMETEDNLSMENEQPQDAPIVVKKPGRRGRKSKNATDSPAEASPAPGEPRFIDVNETLGRRKVATSSSHWSETDIADFLKLLERHGKNFKRISASLPSKTVAQVSNYYKNHKKELGLEQIALNAQNRSSSPETEPNETSNSHQFVEVTPADASQSQTPTEEFQLDSSSKDKVPPPAERTWVGEQQSNPSHPQPMPSRPCPTPLNHQPFILQSGPFTGPDNARRMIIPAHSPIPYAVAVTTGPPAPVASPVPHGPSQIIRPSQGQAEGDPHVGQGHQGVDARYSSFRAQLPRGTVFISDKRMPIPILPASGHIMPLRPDGYPYIHMHPGAAIHYAPVPSPDQLAHVRIPSLTTQRVHPVEAARPIQASTSTGAPHSVYSPLHGNSAISK